MRPLLFVNWRAVNKIFCGLMWFVVLVLAIVVVAHLIPDASALHQPARFAH
jgi:hypothetical protein